MFLNYIHSFRAVAILFIVAGHSVYLFEWEAIRWQERLMKSLMQNGTVLFVFVAGFLFQHLSHKFEYRRYLKSKLLNVILPYAIVSLPMLAVQALTQRGAFDPAYAMHWPTTLQNALWSLLTGYHILPFWFIPMISVFYLLAPLLLRIDRDGRGYYALPLLLMVTVFVHRPSDFTHIWHSCAYFLPVYLFGMWFSRHRDRVMDWHDRALPWLVALVVGLVWLEVGYLQRGGAIGSAGLFSTENGVFGTNALQKILLCGVLLVILRRYGGFFDRKLDYLAHISFGIYFLHMYFIQGYTRFVAGEVFPGASLLRYWAAVTLVVALCVMCLWIAKKVLGRHSRKFVGS